MKWGEGQQLIIQGSQKKKTSVLKMEGKYTFWGEGEDRNIIQGRIDQL